MMRLVVFWVVGNIQDSMRFVNVEYIHVLQNMNRLLNSDKVDIDCSEEKLVVVECNDDEQPAVMFSPKYSFDSRDTQM